MTGIRKVIGFGELARDFGEKASELPYKLEGTAPNRKPNANKDRLSPLEIVNGTAKDKDNNIFSLIHRFGSGVEISVEREREINYHRDMGFRKYTVASPGMYNISFSIEGYFSPRDFSEWGDALFMNAEIELTGDTLVYTKKSKSKGGNGVKLSTYVESASSEGVGYIIGENSKGSRLEVPNELLKKYFTDINDNGFIVRVIYPELLNNPINFAKDISTLKLNEHTPNGGANEVGILCGCVFESGSFTYEVGGDMGLKFSLSGFALRDYKNFVYGNDTPTEFRDEIDEVDPNIYVTGCLSIKKTKDDTFEEIAYTDSASFEISNNVEKLPDCGQLVYSAGVMGVLEINQKLKTYSHEPDRYLPALYGVEFEKESNGKLKSTKTYSIAKQPLPLDALLIRSTDSKYTGSDEVTDYTKFIDMVTREIYVSQLNNSYASDTKIMDEPTVQPFFGWIAYGFKEEE